jgi:dTDP-4-amino-4,6-dideoxygalactose transaminase
MDMGAQAAGHTGTVVMLNASGPWSLPAAALGPGQDAFGLRAKVTSEISQLVGSPPGLELTSSCTHAMEAASIALGIGPGDEVVVPSFTFPSTANAFLLSGATIRFADVDPATGNIDPSDVERLSGPATKVVVCTHYGGVACDMAALDGLSSQKGFALVEDAAHGLFASLHGIPLGRFGALGALSFHRTKNLSSVDGGAVVVNEAELVERVQVAIDKGTNRAAFEEGRVTSYEWTGPGSAWRMPDPMVALLAAQLEHRDEIQRARHHAWNRYHRELTEWADRAGVRLPSIPDGCIHPAHLYWLVLPESMPRQDFVAHCASVGIQVARHYGSLADSGFGRTIRHPADECPDAAVLGERLVRLPMHHELTDADIDRVVASVISAPKVPPTH